MQEVIDANNGKYDEATIFALQQKWMQLRVADIEFVLDTLLAQAQDPLPMRSIDTLTLRKSA